jgi:hypothetical protein
MTPARIEIFKKIFRMKVLGAMLIFDQNDAVLRIETSDALYNAERVEKIVKGFLSQIPALVPTEEETKAFSDQDSAKK